MKIKEISFKNKRHRWELEKTKFSDLTLLVGASGVGKTQILNSIMKLKNISNGYAYNGVEWDFHFIADDSDDYRWSGEFESIKEIEQQEFREKEISGSESLKQIPRLLNEKLYLDDKLVFERDESNVRYEKKDVPKISPHKSVLNLFTKESKVLPVKSAFHRIIFLDYHSEKNDNIDAGNLESFLSINNKAGFLETLKDFEKLNFSLIEKLFLTYQLFKKDFDEIVFDFKDIFPQVEGIRFELLEKQDIYELQIKEQGTDWISQGEISSGMFKTLMHISGMRLLAGGSVILIDEFENSLGVNCIDSVAGDLVHPEKNLQYIVTSHHPYIINNIDMKYWKVVMRKGANVYTRNAVQLKLGKSKHEAFKQLLNLEEFAEGIS